MKQQPIPIGGLEKCHGAFDDTVVQQAERARLIEEAPAQGPPESLHFPARRSVVGPKSN